jgi:pimeloyl-ACP methyl ester carboxylesterase
MPLLRHCLAIVLAALAFWGCDSDTAWQRDGTVASRSLTVKARGTDLVTVDLYAPATAVEAGPQQLPGLVLCPGGLVEPRRYAWLARRLAGRGFAVAIPHFPSNLGFFAIDNAQVARRVLTQGLSAADQPALAQRVAVAGHSLGAVVAAAVATDGGFAGLALLAGYPAEGDPVESLRIPALSLVAGDDCSATRAAVRGGWLRLPPGSLWALVDGMSHYGFTDSLAEDDKAACAHPLPLDQAHDRAGQLLEAFLRRALSDPAVPLPQLPGVSLEVRP